MAEHIELRLVLERDVIDLLRAQAKTLASIALALDTSRADQAAIAAELRPITERLERLETSKKD